MSVGLDYVAYWIAQPMLCYMVCVLHDDVRHDAAVDADLAHIWVGYFQEYGPGI